MLIQILLFVVKLSISIGGATCPAGFVYHYLYPDICYYTYYYNWPGTFATATNKCQQAKTGSTLPMFKSLSEYDSYRQLMLLNATSLCGNSYWLGIPYTNASQWLDGTAITLPSYWQTSIKQSNGTTYYCTLHRATGGVWQSVPCSTIADGYVCQYRFFYSDNNTEQTTVLTKNDCPEGWSPDSYGICYLYVSTTATWDYAEAYCESLGATLPRFNNDSELHSYNDLLSAMFIDCTAIHWLGFWAPTGKNDHQWINGSIITSNVSYWYNGYKNGTNVRGESYGWVYNSRYSATTSTDTKKYTCQMRSSDNPFNTVFNQNLTIFTPNCSLPSSTTTTLSPITASTSSSMSTTDQTTTSLTTVTTYSATTFNVHIDSTLQQSTDYTATTVITTSTIHSSTSSIPLKTTTSSSASNMSNSATMTTMTGSSAATITSINCPAGFVHHYLYPDICYTIIPWVVSFASSVSDCQSRFGSTLPMFKSLSEYDSYRQLMLLNATSNVICRNSYWLGISSSNASQWLDGSAVTLPCYWQTSITNNYCTVHRSTGGIWKSVPCTRSNADGYVCQYRLNSNTEQTIVPTNNDCSEGWSPDSYGICYLYVSTSATWDCAEAYCESLGATLPRFNNDSELHSYNDLLSAMFIDCAAIQWLGFWAPIGSNDHQWINGSYITNNVSYWYSGYKNAPYVRGESYGWVYNSIYSATQSTYTITSYMCQMRSSNNPFNTVFNQNLTVFTPTCFLPSTTTTSLTTVTTYPATTFNVHIDSTSQQSTSLTSTNANQNYSVVVAAGIQELLYDPIATVSTIQDIMSYLTSPLSESLLKQLGYQFNEIISNCTFAGVPCGEQNFRQTYDATYGNCYTFNYGLYPRIVKEAGNLNGLRVVLKTAVSNYLCSSESTGFIIVLHDNNRTAFPSSEGYKIAPATDNYIAFEKNIITKAGGQYSDCLKNDQAPFIFDESYTTEGCYHYCFQNYVNKSCGCVDPRYNLIKNSVYCTVEKKICLDYIRSCEALLTKESCGCNDLCSNVDFPTILTKAKIINEDYMDFSCDTTNGKCTIGNEEPISILNVYYNTMSSIHYVEVPSYTIFNFLSDITNILGLLLGFCMITLFEASLMLLYAFPAAINCR